MRVLLIKVWSTPWGGRSLKARREQRSERERVCKERTEGVDVGRRR